MIRKLRGSLTERQFLVVLVLFIGGFLVGMGAFTFNYAHGTSYFSNNPETCLNCHVMRDQYDAWRHSSHSRVAVCNDCHTPHTFPEKYIVKGINGFNHSLAFTLGNFHEPITIRDFNADVVQHNCVYCHQNLVNQIHNLYSSEPVECVSCHSNVGHRTRD